MKATRLLIDEHQCILRALGVIDQIAARVANGEEPNARDIESVLQFLQFFGDAHHQEKEESVLFPALLKASDSEEHESLCQVTFEHNQQRSLLEGIEDALRSHNGPDFLYYTKRLGELVRAHIRSEEDDVFKRADMMLSTDEDERVARELAAYDTPIQAGKLTDLLERLAEMEAEYGPLKRPSLGIANGGGGN